MALAPLEAEIVAPVPRISVQAFCETQDVAQILQGAYADRRMEKAHSKLHMGGAMAAVEAFRTAPTPNVIVLESTADRDQLLEHLESLSEFCDAGTRVIVAGRVNDIVLYRELMARGVSDYLVWPFSVMDFIKVVSNLYGQANLEPLGKIIAVTGVKGGVGASSIAHNIAFSVARDLHLQTIIIDMDLGFGTAGLDFNQDPPQGIAEAVFAPERLDSNLLDRLLSRCTDKPEHPGGAGDPRSPLRLLGNLLRSSRRHPAHLRRPASCSISRMSGRVGTEADAWSAPTRSSSLPAPDLANLRNAKSMIDNAPDRAPARRAAPPRDEPGRRAEASGDRRSPISAKAVDMSAEAVIPFEPKLFGTAANNGQMIVEVEGLAQDRRNLRAAGPERHRKSRIAASVEKHT